MMRRLAPWLCSIACLAPLTLSAQETVDPVTGSLRHLSAQISQLRQITTKNGQAQQGMGVEQKRQLVAIEQQLKQLETAVNDLDSKTQLQNQQQISALQTTNTRLLIVIAGLVLLLIGQWARRKLGACTLPTAPSVSTPAQPVAAQPRAEAPQPAEQPPSDSVTQPDTPPKPQDLGAAPSITLDRIVATDLQETQSALSEARKGFMKPVDINR